MHRRWQFDLVARPVIGTHRSDFHLEATLRCSPFVIILRFPSWRPHLRFPQRLAPSRGEVSTFHAGPLCLHLQ